MIYKMDIEQSVKSEQEQKVELQIAVGEYLAGGFTNGEILALLGSQHALTAEEAQAVLRAVYDTWTSVREGLNLQMEDDRNWHKYLRMKLLQKALGNESTPSQRLVLQILDSLAGIQGISTEVEQPVPLSIELVEKKPEPTEPEKEVSE